MRTYYTINDLYEIRLTLLNRLFDAYVNTTEPTAKANAYDIYILNKKHFQYDMIAGTVYDQELNVYYYPWE